MTPMNKEEAEGLITYKIYNAVKMYELLIKVKKTGIKVKDIISMNDSSVEMYLNNYIEIENSLKKIQIDILYAEANLKSAISQVLVQDDDFKIKLLGKAYPFRPDLIEYVMKNYISRVEDRETENRLEYVSVLSHEFCILNKIPVIK